MARRSTKPQDAASCQGGSKRAKALSAATRPHLTATPSAQAPGNSSSSTKRVALAVVIMKNGGVNPQKKRGGPSTSSSALTSADSSAMPSPIEATPDTSVFNTPAESVRGMKNGSTDHSPITEGKSTRRSGSRLALRIDPTAADEEMARRLQEQEYAEYSEAGIDFENASRRSSRATKATAKEYGEGSEPLLASWERKSMNKNQSDDAESLHAAPEGKGKGKAIIIPDSESELSEVPSYIAEAISNKRKRPSKGKAKVVTARRTRSSYAASEFEEGLMDVEADLSELDMKIFENESSRFGDKDDDFVVSDDSIVAFEDDDSDDCRPIAKRPRRRQQEDGDQSTIASASGSVTPAGSAMEAVRVAARNRAALRARRRRRWDPESHLPWDRKQARRKKLEKAHPEIKTMWDDLAKMPVIKPIEAEQPKTITRRLKPFQLEGLNWMIRQEKESAWKGGLLGDEMGMGKTIQAVSLIMSDHPAKAPSLVLVPPVALMQWANEIKEYTSGTLKVLICHGTNKDSKNLTAKKIRSYDVIVMSYNSLESMHRKEVKGWTRGEVIVKEASPIHAVHFHRLILDEAHSIKSRNTGVAKACFALKGKYKWCLSGTPVQNRIGEFFSLLRFLEVRPFADYFCEKCDCAQLHWSIDAESYCTSCKHASSEHRSVFNEELLNPITGDSETVRQEALEKLHMITDRVMLRRMKKDHISSMELPPKEILIHNEFFGEIERDFSSSIMSSTTRQFDTYVARGVMLNNYANIFGLIMQMRQVANHPDLILRKHAEEGQNVLVCNICAEVAEEAIRSRCRHEFCRACARTYIQSASEAGDADVECPKCHIPLVIDWEQPDIEQDEEQVKKSSIINRIKMESWTSSTKIEMLVYDLFQLRRRKGTLKSIVFSQFTSMLQLIEWRLRRAGFETVMLDGSMSPAQRQRSIDHFMKHAAVEVFLVSLKAGGVALNLTEASRVFIVDPWWNPAAEWQSADRCHRIGQNRPCVIKRLVIEDSVESRMVLLQEKKARMIAGTVNQDKVAMEKLSPEDLQFLFRGT